MLPRFNVRCVLGTRARGTDGGNSSSAVEAWTNISVRSGGLDADVDYVDIIDN